MQAGVGFFEASGSLEFECHKECKYPCAECLKMASEIGPVTNYEQPLKKIQNVGSYLVNLPSVEDFIPAHVPDSIQVYVNESNNKEGSYEVMRWNLPYECFKVKCDVCRILSCCNYSGLFSFCWNLFEL